MMISKFYKGDSFKKIRTIKNDLKQTQMLLFNRCLAQTFVPYLNQHNFNTGIHDPILLQMST